VYNLFHIFLLLSVLNETRVREQITTVSCGSMSIEITQSCSYGTWSGEWRRIKVQLIVADNIKIC